MLVINYIQSGVIIYTYITGIIQTLQTFIMYTNMNQCNYSGIPLLSAFPFLIPLWPPLVSLYLLGTLLAVIGSCPPRSQVARKLISPFLSPSPYTPLSKILTPWGFPELNMHITKTTSRNWLTRSSTVKTQDVGSTKTSSGKDTSVIRVIYAVCFQFLCYFSF